MKKVGFEETGGTLSRPRLIFPSHRRPERLTEPPKRVAMSRTGTGRSGQNGFEFLQSYEQDWYSKECSLKVSVNVPVAFFFQYSVLIKSKDKQEVEGKGIGRKVMDKLYQKYSSELAGKNFAYDGEKALYTVGSLPQKKIEFTVVLEDAAVKRSGSPDLTGMETDCKRTKNSFRSKTSDVDISFTARIPMKPIALALKKLEAENCKYIYTPGHHKHPKDDQDKHQRPILMTLASYTSWVARSHTIWQNSSPSPLNILEQPTAVQPKP